MKKNKQQENYLDKVPSKNSNIGFSVADDGKVTLEIENKGVFNRVFQKLFKKPKISYIHLDEFGSFVWQQIDGEKDITHIGEAVEAKFGEKAHPLYERLVKYFEILKSYSFITFKD
ncbi:MAG: PqqD family protein [Clostridia bacterium]|nr:PqqD family protein [Clostridia bacterium]